MRTRTEFRELSRNEKYRNYNEVYDKRVGFLLRMGFKRDRETNEWRKGPTRFDPKVENSFVMSCPKWMWMDRMREILRTGFPGMDYPQWEYWSGKQVGK